MSNQRWTSIDFLRGLTVAAMILVNNPGSWEHIYPMLHHAEWHGCTIADLVFPFFIVIMGISIVLSLHKVKLSQHVAPSVYLKILKRSSILILLGLALNFIPDFSFSSLRWPGVLQRLGLVYLFCAFLYLFLSYRLIAVLTVLILISYWLIMTMVPAPGVAEANLQPTTNLAAWIVYALMNGHLWKYSEVWDPEGLLSSLPAIASGLFGILIGHHLKTSLDLPSKLKALFFTGLVLVLLGWLFDFIFPMNKSLWTSSYVLFSSGMAIIVLAVSSYFFELRAVSAKYVNFFLAFGYNPITAYFLSEIIAKLADFITLADGLSLKSWMFNTLFASWPPLQLASVLMAVSWLIIFYIPLYFMYKRRILIKI